MSEQSVSGTMAGDIGAHGLDAQTGLPQGHEAHHGRPASWAVTVLVVIGFTIGGIALPIGPTWWLFWTGAGLVVVGALMGAAVRIFDDWY